MILTEMYTVQSAKKGAVRLRRTAPLYPKGKKLFPYVVEMATIAFERRLIKPLARIRMRHRNE